MTIVSTQINMLSPAVARTFAQANAFSLRGLNQGLGEFFIMAPAGGQLAARPPGQATQTNHGEVQGMVVGALFRAQAARNARSRRDVRRARRNGSR